MGTIKILREKCIGCGVCKVKCPYGSIIMNNKKAEILDSCSLCKTCADACKFGAIIIENDEFSYKAAGQHKGIWVFVEHKGETVSKVTLELVTEAKKLALELGTEVSAVLLGHDVENFTQTLTEYGADNIYLVDHPSLKNFNNESYRKIITELVMHYKPDIFLLGATAYGRSLAPRISAALNTGLTADCTQLEIDRDKKLLLQTRPAFGGNLMATIICPDKRPQMATVRPGIFKASVYPGHGKGKIIRPNVQIPESSMEVLKYIENTSEVIDISRAEIIVAAGKGMGNQNNLKLVKELAELIGGEVGATRTIVDEGWIERCHQVGQSGNTVSPKLYIACGISGAIQHMAGLRSANVIIAINKDAEAPIMKAANYAFVGDAVEILKTFISEIKRLRANCNI